MRRFSLSMIGLAAALFLIPRVADAQYGFPRAYGGFGWGGFNANQGNDPAAGYMAGLGAYARGQGVYEVEDAKAQSINADTMLKWNKALRARQSELRAEQQKADARKESERKARVARDYLEDGTTINNLLLPILEFDPGLKISSKVDTPLNPAVIREIPFEWDTEAITICIDQLTGQDSLPNALSSPQYAGERLALKTAVTAAIREDEKGNVSPQTKKSLDEAIGAFRAKFVQNTPEFDPSFNDSTNYFSTLASLTRLLNDPSMKKILGELEDGKPRTLGNLIAFMNSYNLRFGATTSPRQVEIYEQLIPALTAIRDRVTAEQAPLPSSDNKAGDLKSASHDIFRGMSWDDLQAHSKSQ
ncbi:hypothetical protein P12x_004549 [Tundrisphaera lichenicola]|uniref:hypothetical protein n=1 Tax=Tundrisphaera lichenicola TaxID=2029860 RepID=UPI003EB7EE34